eukprot:9113629-Lingulodinium_polyedra.AAC.1
MWEFAVPEGGPSCRRFQHRSREVERPPPQVVDAGCSQLQVGGRAPEGHLRPRWRRLSQPR